MLRQKSAADQNWNPAPPNSSSPLPVRLPMLEPWGLHAAISMPLPIALPRSHKESVTANPPFHGDRISQKSLSQVNARKSFHKKRFLSSSHSSMFSASFILSAEWD